LNILLLQQFQRVLFSTWPAIDTIAYWKEPALYKCIKRQAGFLSKKVLNLYWWGSQPYKSEAKCWRGVL